MSKTHRVPWYLLCRLKPTMGIVSIIKETTRYSYRFLPADELKDTLSWLADVRLILLEGLGSDMSIAILEDCSVF